MKRRLLLFFSTVLLLFFTGAALRRTSSVDAVSGATKLKKLKENAVANTAFPEQETELNGEELKIADSAFPSDLDPAHGNGRCTVAYGVGETLIAFDGESLRPWLAQSWENIDPLTWEIRLKSGVKFQNGRAMTAQSVKESLERAVRLNPDAAKLLSLASVRAEGLTVTIRTSAPCPCLLHNLADPAFVIVDASADQKKDFAYFPVCTGPFIPATFIGQMEVILRRFDGYHGGDPKLGGADILFVPDAGKLAQKLKSRTADAAADVPPERLSELTESGFQAKGKDTGSAYFLMMNMNSPLLKDPSVRQAVATAVGKQAAGGAFSPALPFADQTDPYPYSPDAAKSLLAKAGHGTLSLRLALPAGDEGLLKRAQAVKTQLKQIGIDVAVKTYNDVFFTSRARYGKFDLLLTMAKTAENGDAQSFFETYAASGGSLNYGAYRSGRVDAELARLQREFDPDRRVLLTDQVQSAVMRDAAFVFLGYSQTNAVTSKAVSGLSVGPGGYRLTADTSK